MVVVTIHDEGDFRKRDRFVVLVDKITKPLTARGITITGVGDDNSAIMVAIVTKIRRAEPSVNFCLVPTKNGLIL